MPTNNETTVTVLILIDEISPRWYGALSNIDVGKSILKSKYIHWFRIFKFNNILLKMFQKNFGNLKMIKASLGFKLVTYRFVGNVLTRCTMLFFGKTFFFLN